MRLLRLSMRPELRKSKVAIVFYNYFLSIVTTTTTKRTWKKGKWNEAKPNYFRQNLRVCVLLKSAVKARKKCSYFVNCMGRDSWSLPTRHINIFSSGLSVVLRKSWPSLSLSEINVEANERTLERSTPFDNDNNKRLHHCSVLNSNSRLLYFFYSVQECEIDKIYLMYTLKKLNWQKFGLMASQPHDRGLGTNPSRLAGKSGYLYPAWSFADFLRGNCHPF